MNKKLFISNLDFSVTEDQVKEAIYSVAQAKSIVLAIDKATKRSRGFAFVEMNTEDDAQKVIEQLNGMVLNGRPIKVSEDRGKGDDKGVKQQKKYEPLPPIQRISLFRKQKKIDPFLKDPSKVIDYRDIAMLQQFISERGKILPRTMTGLTAYHQRKVKKAIKRAQNLGLMPFCIK